MNYFTDPYGVIYTTHDGKTATCDADMYDWCFEEFGTPRTPKTNPYNFSAHYLWRDFDKDDKPPHDSAYTDRMYMWDSDKMERALDKTSSRYGKLSENSSIRNRTSKDCQIIVQRYWGKGTKCIGYALDCNQSTGYELGIFLFQSKEQQND